MESVLLLFEGICPTCRADVEIVEVSGTREFLADYRFDGEFEQRVWQPSIDGMGEDGMVRFVCPAGHQHEAYHLSQGDWVA